MLGDWLLVGVKGQSPLLGNWSRGKLRLRDNIQIGRRKAGNENKKKKGKRDITNNYFKQVITTLSITLELHRSTFRIRKGWMWNVDATNIFYHYLLCTSLLVFFAQILFCYYVDMHLHQHA